jgi:UDP-N-acetylglucosamine--N-acetylmuramyl-(pentapeptide) pyrophosphoryl-undecaprenol N-acetylglucosamine transferase
MEAKLVPQHGFEMVWVKFAALRGKGLLRKLLLPLNLLRGFLAGQKADPSGQAGRGARHGRLHHFPGGMMAALPAAAGRA